MQTKLMTAGFLIAFGAVAFTGCSKAPTKPNAATTKTAGEGHSHGGWWCDEHGVPEEKCGLCDAKLAEKFKADGDWCKEHDRPESQCFVCNPEKEAVFAAEYEAKYGKKPPKPTDTGADAHDHDHDHDHKHDEKS